MKKQVQYKIRSKGCLALPLVVFAITLYSQDFAVDGIEYGITSTSPAEVEVVGYTGSATGVTIPPTVNGDGANDRWIIDDLSENASMRIYDWHSTIIFSSNDGYTRSWDGTSRGRLLPTGSYLCLVQNGPHIYKGTVTILL